MSYFSDRELGPKPRILEEINLKAWGGIYSLINERIDDGSFGNKCPLLCPDEDGVVGSDSKTFTIKAQSEVPDLDFPISHEVLPPTYQILDLIEFCYRIVAKPIRGYYHEYWRRYHLNFDVESGQKSFREEVNNVLSRNGIAFDLNSDGQIVRLAPEIIRESLGQFIFVTNDPDLDQMLNSARSKFLSPNLNSRRESLEKLWDAWERLKTLEPPQNDKKKSIENLIGKVSSEQAWRTMLDKEASELTGIGNNFMIRHTEVGKHPISESEQVDYLFQRMFALIYLFLRKTNRLAENVSSNIEDIDF